MADYRNDMSIYGRAMIAPRSRPEIAGASGMDASELRAKALRYRRLAEALHDPRVIAEVHACARDLEAEASWIERQAAYKEQLALKRHRIGN